MRLVCVACESAISQKHGKKHQSAFIPYSDQWKCCHWVQWDEDCLSPRDSIFSDSPKRVTSLDFALGAFQLRGVNGRPPVAEGVLFAMKAVCACVWGSWCPDDLT